MDPNALPRRLRNDQSAAAAYQNLHRRLVDKGLLDPRMRPMSLRNVLNFFRCVIPEPPLDTTPKAEGEEEEEEDWRIRLLRCYHRHTRCRTPRTWTAWRAHARWLTCLLRDRCPRAREYRPHELGAPIAAHTKPLPARHAFNREEVCALHAAAARTGPFSELLLRLLFTTGLRVGGVSRLALPRHDGEETLVTEEKGGVLRTVRLSPPVWDALRRWGSTPRPGQRYLFAARRDATRSVSTSHLKKHFRRLCQCAGVTGPHAHIHTTRHTVCMHRCWASTTAHGVPAVALRLAGARLVDIAAFLGHCNVNTTYAVYSAPSHEELMRCLRLPWLAADGGGGPDTSLLDALATGQC